MTDASRLAADAQPPESVLERLWAGIELCVEESTQRAVATLGCEISTLVSEMQTLRWGGAELEVQAPVAPETVPEVHIVAL